MQRLWINILSSVFILSVVLLSAPNAIAQKQTAPGLLKTIPSNLDPRDSFSLPMPLPGLNASSYEPKFVSSKDTLQSLGKGIILFRDVWEYEFSFLGQLRQARLEVPDLETGTTSQKNVWYLLYRVRDLGSTLTYDQVKENPDFEHMLADLKRDRSIPAEKKFFLPRLSLEGSVISRASDGYQKVAYHDKISPMVLRQIQRLEDPSLNLLDPISMSQTTIPLAKTDADGGVWGVAVFEDVDPRIDFVSVYVGGLTNAFRINKNADQRNPMKTLQLNFWRPGDVVAEEDDRIDYGIPLVDDPQKQVLITERYDLPGPVVKCYYLNVAAANRMELVAEVDAKVNLKTFQSELTPTLDQGKMAETISQALSNAGISINKQATLKTVVPGKRWSFSEGENQYILSLEPQFWEHQLDRNVDKIRFIKSLDYLWIYR